MQYVDGLDVARTMLYEVHGIYQNTKTAWELVSDENNCQTYSAQIDKDLIHFKSCGEIDCSAEQVWNVLYNPENQEIWDNFCFKVSDTIGSVDTFNSGWTLFRRQSEAEFYYRDVSDFKVDSAFNRHLNARVGGTEQYGVVDFIASGFFNVDAPLEQIESFIVGCNTPLIDTWTYRCEFIKEIDEKSSIMAMTFRTVLAPGEEVKNYVLKQKLSLPSNISFIGIKSIEHQNQNFDIWFEPTGYFIVPLEKGWSVRYLFHFKMIYIKNQQICKKKLLLSLSEKLVFTFNSMKNQMEKLDSDYHPHYDQFKDADEILDYFSKMAIQEIDKEPTEERKEEFYKSVINLPKEKATMMEKKRKFDDYDSKLLIASPSQSFCYMRNSILPLSFKSRPFLLLVSNSAKRVHINMHAQKSPRLNYLNSNTIFDMLPEEIIQYVFGFLEAADLASISMTCKVLKETSSTDHLWKTLFDRKFKLNMSCLFHDDKCKNNNNNGNNNNNNSNSNQNQNQNQNNNNLNQNNGIMENWRKLFISQETIENNWKRGKSRISFLQGHDKKITSLQFGMENAVTSSRDKELRVWNLGTKQCIKVLDNFTSSVVSFESDNNSKLSTEIFPYCLSSTGRLRIGSSNGLVVHLNMVTMESIPQVRFVYLADGYIFHREHIYVWEANRLQLWNEETSQRLFLLETGRSKINVCRLGQHPQLFTAGDKTLKLWDINTLRQESQQQPVLTFAGHSAAVSCFDFLGDHNIVTGSHDKSIKVWDIRQPIQPVQNIVSAHKKQLRSLKIVSNQKMVTSDDTCIQIWTTNNLNNNNNSSNNSNGNGNGHVDNNNNNNNSNGNNKYITGSGWFKSSCILDSFKNGLSCLEVDDESILAGFNDGIVKYYDFTSCPQAF
ncbi:WD40 repeat-containing protein [Cavenderia fasciculata]|uniref:WD40 repeat-containing protein n=1 Tax=Cavenderia fasciculata TaxID=261658 RepID=F4Q977_CACFS|nr:WD40 repeat-containing protein [Cavenderia fasciculata]EGG15246.1 WD40 repeat-containing protein [Cavenderia fasciculata]|eukprot:XP_004351966.1 WD40 repeat-containing protein [Cavenderia fasciculata]